MNFDSIIYEFDDEHKHENLVCNWRYDDYLSNNSITLITNQSNDIFNWQNCFLLRTYLNSIKTHSMLRNHWLTQQRMKQKKNEKKKQRELITSRRQSCWMRRLIQRVPGIDFVLTTLYFPFGFHTWIETGFAIESVSESRWWWTNFS